MQVDSPIQQQTTQTRTTGTDYADNGSIVVTAPGRFRVIRRNGKVTAYDREKIVIALTKAFLAIEGGNAAPLFPQEGHP